MRYCVKGFSEKDIKSVSINTLPPVGNVEFSGVLSDGTDFTVDVSLYGVLRDDLGAALLTNAETASLLYSSSVVYLAQNDAIDTATEDKIRSAIHTALKEILPQFFFAVDKSRIGIDEPPYVSLTQILNDSDFRYNMTDIKSRCADAVQIDKNTCFLLLSVADEIENIKAMLDVCFDNLSMAERQHDFKDICYHLDAIKESYAYLFKAEEIAKETEPIVKIEAEYCPSSDTTFLMENTYSAFGELMTAEVVSFYYGEPDDDSTKFYARNRSLKAEMQKGVSL